LRSGPKPGYRIHEWLDPVLRESVAAENAYVFKGRLKKSEDIKNKVQGYRNHEDPIRRRPNYAATDVTDASGFRIVKLFNAEVPEALDQLLSTFKTTLRPGKPNGRLKGRGIKEIEFHTSRRLDDPLSIFQAVKGVVEKHGFTLEPPAQEAGHGVASSYSSVHVLVECEVGDAPNQTTAFSEIQLRSVFEEAWSEISHRLRYAPAKTARASAIAPISEDETTSGLWLHLDALKSVTDGCAQYADLINRQIKSLATARANREPEPLDPAEKSASLFAGCSPVVRQAVEQAYRRRTDAVETGMAADRAAAFQQAADAFQAAIDAFPELETERSQQLADILREELAYCYMFAKNEELTNRAEKIYRELLTRWPKRVSILLRLGQLRRDAGDFPEAKVFMEAGLHAEECNPDPDPEVHRLASWRLRKDLAVVCWRLVYNDHSRVDAVSLMRRGIELSETSLQYVKTDAQLRNTQLNLLFYLAELWKKLSPDQRQNEATKGTKLLVEIRPKVDLEHSSSEELDTVARGEVVFGERARAEAAARIIRQRLAARMATIRDEQACSLTLAFEALSRDEREMYLCAQDVLAAI
jgi:ppGpp synthetase/RelA/SpoT-type nucleotidyltranferase